MLHACFFFSDISIFPNLYAMHAWRYIYMRHGFVSLAIDTIDYVTGIGNSNVIASDDRFAGSEV